MSSNLGQLWRWSALALLTGGLAAAGLSGCNSHPVEYTTATSNFGVTADFSPSNAGAVDILWVIDNSGSMCEEQDALATNFDQFISTFAGQNIDFQMGVTTTHQKPEMLPAEFLAKYGQLQATPNPIPTQFEACSSSSAVQIALDRAASCAKDTVTVDTTIEPDEAACLDDRESSACQTYCSNNVDKEWCTQIDTGYRFNPAKFLPDLFPPGDAYRDLPLVLRRDDYAGDDDVLSTAESQRLRDDFNCMSFVGTRGWSFEKGLGAAVAATSPDMVGAPYDPEATPPENAPNYGLIREDANFALIFVTDENDCTYDNDRGAENPDVQVADNLKIEELQARSCRDDVCDFANSTQVDPSTSPLIPPEDIKDQILAQLSEIKGRDFSLNEMIVASIHGIPIRFSGPDLTIEDCAADGYEETATTCSGPLGSAYSGDRYQRFVDQFESGRRFPNADNPGDAGKICGGTFATTLNEIADVIVGANNLCITEPVFRCTDSSQCPNPEFLSAAGVDPECEQFAASDETYCRNAIQLVMTAPAESEDPAADLANTDYCYGPTIDSPEFPNSCLVRYDRYSLDPCPELDTGLTVNWTSDNPVADIGDFGVEVTYAVTPEGVEDDTQQQ